MNNSAKANFAPIFIVGNERSGTTLLASLFDRHSQLAVPPETHLFYSLTRTQSLDRQQGSHEDLMEVALSQPRVQDMQLDRDEVLTRFRQECPNLRNAFRSILETYASGRGKPRIAEKSPHHLLHVPTILQWYPEARVICIVRDGRDATLSLMEVPWAHNDVWLHATIWRRLVKLGIRFEAQFPGQFTSIRFEDLLQNPRGELSRLMNFAGLDFEEQQLDPSVGTSVVPQWESDWKAKVNQALDPSRCYAWRRTAPKELVWRMNAVMRPYLERLGYPEPGLEDCPWRLRLRNSATALFYRMAYGPALNPPLRSLKAVMVRLGLPEDWRGLFRDGNGTE